MELFTLLEKRVTIKIAQLKTGELSAHEQLLNVLPVAASHNFLQRGTHFL